MNPLGLEVQQLADALRPRLGQGVALLIKGSRSVGLELIADKLQVDIGTDGAAGASS